MSDAPRPRWPFIVACGVLTWLWFGTWNMYYADREAELRCVPGPGYLSWLAWPISTPAIYHAKNRCAGWASRRMYGPPVLPGESSDSLEAKIRDNEVRHAYLMGSLAEMLCGVSPRSATLAASAAKTQMCQRYRERFE